MPEATPEAIAEFYFIHLGYYELKNIGEAIEKVKSWFS